MWSINYQLLIEMDSMCQLFCLGDIFLSLYLVVLQRLCLELISKDTVQDIKRDLVETILPLLYSSCPLLSSFIVALRPGYHSFQTYYTCYTRTTTDFQIQLETKSDILFSKVYTSYVISRWE